MAPVAGKRIRMLRVYIDSGKVTGDMPRGGSITGVAVKECRKVDTAGS